MIRISVEVGQGTARYRIAIRAKNIGRALEIVGSQSTGREVKIRWPTNPEAFYVREAGMMVGALDREAA